MMPQPRIQIAKTNQKRNVALYLSLSPANIFNWLFHYRHFFTLQLNIKISSKYKNRLPKFLANDKVSLMGLFHTLTPFGSGLLNRLSRKNTIAGSRHIRPKQNKVSFLYFSSLIKLIAMDFVQRYFYLMTKSTWTTSINFLNAIGHCFSATHPGSKASFVFSVNL